MANCEEHMATKIPAPPWTVEHLGEELYCKLATEYGCFNPAMEATTYRPPLDLVALYAAQNATQPAKPAQADKKE
jgi:hypothetical protein